MEKEKIELFAMSCTLQLFSNHEYKNRQLKLLGEPESYFSGCIYKNHILSVLHGFKKEDIVSAFVTSVNGKIEMAILQPCWLRPGRVDVNGKIYLLPELDFFFSEFDKSCRFTCEIIDPEGEYIDAYERKSFDEIAEPNIADAYFFGGNIHPSIDEYNKRINSEFQFASCEYLGECSKEGNNYYYEFELPRAIESADELEGCSGAPIFDSSGRLVSILCGGTVGTDRIYGLNLMRLSFFIEHSEYWNPKS